MTYGVLSAIGEEEEGRKKGKKLDDANYQKGGRVYIGLDHREDKANIMLAVRHSH